MLYFSINLALHHSGPIVIFDVASPSGLIHEATVILLVLLKSLFAEILDSVVVGVGEEVVDIL
jgi:hypothetical protein